MVKLYNKKGKPQLLQDLAKEDFRRITCSFYRYVPLGDVQALRDALFVDWEKLKVLGRVYVAKEGINAQISVPEPQWENFVADLNGRPEFKDMPFKFAVEEGQSFLKLTIKVKQEIVAYRVPEDEYDMNNVGPHLNHHEYNKAIDEGAIVLDMRNEYEAEVGRFENAIVPQVERSQELLPEAKRLLAGHENDKVLIYCTGGIRCEKASAYLKHHGFSDVNQLDGGIIKYAHKVKEDGVESKFIGKNYVFDARMGERVTEDILSTCHQCDEACDDHTNCANSACHILFIQCPSCAETYQGCCSAECAEFIALPLDEQKAIIKQGDLQFTAQRSDKIKPKLKEMSKPPHGDAHASSS